MSNIATQISTIMDMIDKFNYKSGSLKVARHDGHPTFLFSRLDLNDDELDTKAIENIDYDYGRFRLIRRALSISEIKDFLTYLQKNTFKIDTSYVGLGNPFEFTHSFMYSGSSNDLYLFQNPTHYYEIRISDFTDCSYDNIPPKVTLPSYPTYIQAVKDFFHINQNIPQIRSKLTILMPSSSARINKLVLRGKSVELEIECDKSLEQDLCVKLYCSRGTENRYPSPEIKIENLLSNHELDFEPDTVIANLMQKHSDTELDRKSILNWDTSQRGTFIQVHESYVKQLIENGENYHVEFKTNIDDEFLESISSFSNSEGGSIIVGVADNKSILGFYDDEEKTRKKIFGMLKGKIEPFIQPILEWVDIDEKPILLVKIAKGVDKPYVIRDGGVFYRYDEHDIHIRRKELDMLYENRFPSVNDFEI